MFARALAITILYFWQTFAVASAALPAGPETSGVATIAGDGHLAVPGGRALTSGFVLPVGVSVSRDGSILITDAGANAIFRLKDGVVSHVAGAIGTIHDTEGAAGGFADGDARSARFERPSAAVEDASGRIFVADTDNSCIRVIENGRVSLYAGSQAPGTSDGDRTTARFLRPNALASDTDGTLFVSDFGAGIRKIDPSGNVTTVAGTEKKTTNGVAFARIGDHAVLAYTDYDAIHIVVDGKDQALAATRERMPTHESVPVFHGWGIAILNENTVVVSDPITNVIRLIRFPVLPFTDIPASQSVSGTLHEDTDFHGGFHDGATTVALYDSPRAIALDRSGNLVIADAGNRRIRSLSGIDGRETVLPDFSNYAPVPGDRNVTIIGQSLLFNGARWADSTPFVAERTLRASTPAFARPVHVQGIRVDGIDFAAMSGIANEYVVDRGNVDAVAFMLTPITYAQVDDVVAEANLLAASNIKTIVIVLPRATSFSLAEFPVNGCGCIEPVAALEGARNDTRALASAYRDAGLSVIAPLDRMIAAERSVDREALWDAADTHYTPAGQRLLGKIIADGLASDRSWLAPKAHRLPVQDTKALRSCPVEQVPSAISPDSGNVERIADAKTGKTLAAGDTVASADALLFGGWAFDRSHAQSARKICVVVDGSTGAPVSGTENVLRTDVVRVFGQVEAATAGFDLTLDPGRLVPGPHTLAVAEIDGDGSLHTLSKPLAIIVR